MNAIRRAAGTVLLFDGTFGPPHNGHLACARRALLASGPDTQLLVHVSSGAFKHASWPEEARLHLARLCFSQLPNTEVVRFGKRENHALTTHAREWLPGDGRVIRLAGADWVRAFQWWDPRSLESFIRGVDGLMLVQRGEVLTEGEVRDIIRQKLKASLVSGLNRHISELMVTMLEVPDASGISSSGVSKLLAEAPPGVELGSLRALLPPNLVELLCAPESPEFKQYAKDHLAAVDAALRTQLE